MTEASVLQLITVGGAAGAFFMMIKWIADGRFHTHSEVEGLRQDKADLLKVNAAQADALKESNNLLAEALKHNRASERQMAARRERGES